MKYRPMGSTGEWVSEIGFGTGDNAGLLVRGEPGDQCRAFERALELGINYWDTSPDYGDHVGLAEINIGKWMRQLHVRPLITTKVEIMPDQLDDVAGAVLRSLENSLQRLATEWVDVLQIHNPPGLETDTSVSGWIKLGLKDYLGPNGALEGLERARRNGKVRFLGFACEHADPRAVKQLIDTGSFQMINVWYDLLNPTAAYGGIPGMNVGHEYDAIIPYAKAAGVGVATIRPLGGGVLTDHAIGGGARHPLAGGGLSRRPTVYQEMREQAIPLGFLSQNGRSKVSEVAYRFVLDTPGVSTVNGGFSELAHLEEAAGVSAAEPLSPEMLARIRLVWRANYGRPADHAWASA
ncbi:MAG: aldo/keto reductase [Mycobacterium sp.]|nr:aldo/keto reductase [Mycobacterium sp.]